MFSVEDILQQQAGERNLPPWKKKILKQVLKTLLYEKEFIEFDRKYPHLRGLDSVGQVLAYFRLECETDVTELENIPAEGPVVLIANHPIGSLDGLALVKTVATVRPDVKIVANQLLSYLKPLRDVFIGVENMSGPASRQQIKQVQAHLQQRGALILFPAGEVSRFGLHGIRDGQWSSGFIRLAARARAPIVPIHVQGCNTALFYLVSLLNKSLSTYMLVREMFKQKDKKLTIRIGRRIPYINWHDGQTPAAELAERFRRHVYLLGENKTGSFQTEAPIALPEDRQTLKAAVESCETLGLIPDGKVIHLYRRNGEADSPILRELGRLREIAFRAVGEGSGRRRDLDDYDDYYYHLVLWDPHVNEIVGAYRFIPTAEQLDRTGVEGLYSYSLFNYSTEMAAILEYGIELGRSFIQPHYWGKRGLDYLWQGIGAYIARFPQYRYLFGPVSISGTLPVAARDLLISFYRLHFAPQQTVATSRRPYPASLPHVLANFGGTDYQEDLVRLKSMLNNMACGIPTLYKQYSELCEPGGVQFIDFGTDPEFNNCIDGLVLVDMQKLKPSRYQRYIEPYLPKKTSVEPA